MEWIQVLTIVIATIGCCLYFRRETKAEVIALGARFDNARLEMKAENREFYNRMEAENRGFYDRMQAENREFYDRMQAESRDFHGRLCKIEAKNALLYEVILKSK